MYFAKSKLIKFFIVAYLCTFLTGVPFVASSFAKITIKDPSKPLKVITIKKGDTLWDLAEEYLKDPIKWKEFQEYNIYTNPDLIFPDEEMQIPLKMLEDIGRQAVVDIQADVMTLEKFEEMREEIDAKLKELEVAIAQLKANSGTKADLTAIQEQIEDLQKQLVRLTRQPFVSALDLHQAKTEITGKIEKSDEKVGGIETRMDGLEQSLKQGETSLQQVRGDLGEMDKNIEALRTGIDKNQMAIKELKDMLAEEGKIVKPEKKNKRVFAFVTAVLAAATWFVVNSASD